MNRHERRAAAATALPAGVDRKQAISIAVDAIANGGPTATGATLIFPSGETLYISAETARAMASAPAGAKQ